LESDNRFAAAVENEKKKTKERKRNESKIQET
jgi:hypothetical protein